VGKADTKNPQTDQASFSDNTSTALPQRGQVPVVLFHGKGLLQDLHVHRFFRVSVVTAMPSALIFSQVRRAAFL
jgi:hypothetical protein